MSDAIDVEDLANMIKQSFVAYTSDVLYAELLSIAPWVATPVVSFIVKKAIAWAVNILATKAGYVAFIINSRVLTMSQAKDYMDALNKIRSLPDDVPDADWEKAENDANHAFRNLIRFAA